MRLAVRQAISDPLHEGRIEASGFVVWIAWGSWQTGPLIGPLAKHAIFPTGASRPVEEGRILRDEAWPGPQCVRNLLGIRGGMIRRHGLGARSQRRWQQNQS